MSLHSQDHHSSFEIDPLNKAFIVDESQNDSLSMSFHLEQISELEAEKQCQSRSELENNNSLDWSQMSGIQGEDALISEEDSMMNLLGELKETVNLWEEQDYGSLFEFKKKKTLNCEVGTSLAQPS